MSKIREEIKRRNSRNKNYLWIILLIILITVPIFYSFNTNSKIMTNLSIIKEELFAQNESDLESEEITQQIVAVANTKSSFLPIEDIKNEDIKKESIVKQEDTKKVEISGATKKEANKSEVKEISKSEPQKDIANVKEEKLLVSYITERTLDFNIISCGDFEAISGEIPQSCKEQITKFLDKNKNASKYEVIGIIDLEDVQNLTKSTLANQRELGRQRVASAKEFLKGKVLVPITNDSYYLKSDSSKNKGFVLRAYF